MSASALELLPFADTRARATMLHSPDSKGELMASVIPQMFPQNVSSASARTTSHVCRTPCKNDQTWRTIPTHRNVIVLAICVVARTRLNPNLSSVLGGLVPIGVHGKAPSTTPTYTKFVVLATPSVFNVLMPRRKGSAWARIPFAVSDTPMHVPTPIADALSVTQR